MFSWRNEFLSGKRKDYCILVLVRIHLELPEKYVHNKLSQMCSKSLDLQGDIFLFYFFIKVLYITKQSMQQIKKAKDSHNIYNITNTNRKIKLTLLRERV